LPPAFLEEPPDPNDVLYPVTAFRVSFLTRIALTRMPEAAVPADEVYSEVWERRAELIDQLPEGDYECAGADWRLHAAPSLAGSVRVPAVASMLGFASWWLFGSALWNTLQPMYAHRNITLPSAVAQARVAWLALAVAAAVWLTLRWWARRILAHSWSSYDKWYTRVIEGGLTDAIAAMVEQICHRKDELTRGALLPALPAPSLVEFDLGTVVQSQSFRDVRTLIDAHVTSAIGIVGTRGVGKSTLLRLLCSTGGDGQTAPTRIGVYLSAPASSAEGEFVKVIYSTTVRRVIETLNVSLGTRSGWRKLLRISPDNEVVLAQQALERITGSTSRSRQSSLGWSRSGMSASTGGQRTWTERELSHADWVAEFRDYLERHRLRGGGPILIAIDELDKIADPAQVIKVINGLKDLFHIQGTHFVVSVSDDALRSFATRGIPARDAFDSSFDTVIEIPHLTAEDSCRLLQARVRLFPDATILFCHAWSGGVPRDLIRVARSCVAIPHKFGGPVPVTDIAQRIIRRDIAEFTDALIKGGQNQPDSIGPLLELKHQIADDSLPLHHQLAGPGIWHLDGGRATAPDQPHELSSSNDRALSSLEQFLRIASAVSEYFSIPRNSQQWADGIESDSSHRDANLLADAKAALAIHPYEAAWRLRKAVDILGLASEPDRITAP
jgi:hypothetical protein